MYYVSSLLLLSCFGERLTAGPQNRSLSGTKAAGVETQSSCLSDCGSKCSCGPLMEISPVSTCRPETEAAPHPHPRPSATVPPFSACSRGFRPGPRKLELMVGGHPHGHAPFPAHRPQSRCSTSRPWSHLCFKRRPGTVTQTTRPLHLLSAQDSAERVTEVTAAPEGPGDTMENLVLDLVAKKGRLTRPDRLVTCRACRNSPQGTVPPGPSTEN